MRSRWMLAVVVVLLFGGALPASAQMMGSDYEAPWISLALANAKELDLTPDQTTALTAIREEFQKRASQLTQEIRAAEARLAELFGQKAVDLTAVEGKIREIAAQQGELRIARVKALGKGLALLSDEQRQKLSGLSRRMGPMQRMSRLDPPASDQ